MDPVPYEIRQEDIDEVLDAYESAGGGEWSDEERREAHDHVLKNVLEIDETVYALMSFTVAKRAREIGIRAALGADPRSIVLAIFSRAIGQIGLGVVAGAVLVSLTVARSPEGFRLVGGVAAAMVAVGLLGCIVPAMRALRVQPTEALRAE